MIARGGLAAASFDERLTAATAMVSRGWTMDAALNHLEGSCDRAICCGFEDPLTLDPVAALAAIIDHVTAAQAALADEHEGNFGRAVDQIETLAVGLARLTRSW